MLSTNITWLESSRENSWTRSREDYLRQSIFVRLVLLDRLAEEWPFQTCSIQVTFNRITLNNLCTQSNTDVAIDCYHISRMKPRPCGFVWSSSSMGLNTSGAEYLIVLAPIVVSFSCFDIPRSPIFTRLFLRKMFL